VATVLRALQARAALPLTATQALTPSQDAAGSTGGEEYGRVYGAEVDKSGPPVPRERLLELCEIVLNQA